MPINWSDVGATGLGAIDELLFGLPEFVAKKIDRKKVEDYIAKHKGAYNLGEVGGTIGSAFIPFAGIAGKALKGAGLAGKGIGLAAKAAKAADLGTDLVKAGDIAGAALKGGKNLKQLSESIAKYSKLAGKGALAGAGEAGLRGITSEKTPEQIAKDLQTGAIFGGAGGVAGGLLGGAAKRLTGNATKGAEQAFLSTTDLKGRNMAGLLKDMSGSGAKGLGKFKNADFVRQEAVRVGKEIGANISGKADDTINAYGQKWKTLDNIAEKLAPDATAATWLSKAAEGLDLDSMRREFGADVVDGMLKKTLKDATKTQGLFNTRNFLADLVTDARKPGSNKDARLQRLQQEMAHDLRAGVDDMVMDMAESQGTGMDFKQLKRDYLPMRAYAEAMGKADVVPSGISAGSPTMEKLAGAEIAKKLGGIAGTSALGGAAGYGAGGEDPGEKIKNTIIGSIAGAAGSKAIASLATRGIAKTIPLAKMLEKGVAKVAPEAMAKYGAQAGGQLASMAAREATREVQPKTETEAEAVNMASAAGSGDKQEYMAQVFGKLKEYATAQGVAEGSPEYQRFISQVAQVTNGFSPESMAGLFYQDPEEKAAYLKAFKVSKALRETLPGATAEKPGILAREAPEESIARSSAVDQLAALVGDVGKEKGSEKEAKAALTKILNGKGTEERKTELVKTLLSAYGVDFDTLERIGL